MRRVRVTSLRDEMPVQAGTYINAFPVSIPDRQTVTRIVVPQVNIGRRELERRHRTSLLVHGGFAWTAAEVEGQPRIDISSQDELPVHLFNLRGAVGARAARLGWDFWTQQGEMSAVRPEVLANIGPFIVERVLKTRVAWEGLQTVELLLLASAGVRWLVNLPLSGAAVQGIALGESVLRRPGATSGPRRGRVDGFRNGNVVFADRAGGTSQEFPLGGYQLVARPDLAYRLLEALGESRRTQADTYRELLIAAGTLRREDGRKNEYAVKDRFRATEELLQEFLDEGRTLTLANSASATVASDPKEIYPGPGPAVKPWTAAVLNPPRLRFDAAIPSRVDATAFQGLRKYGAYSLEGFKHAPRVLLAYPSASHAKAEGFSEKLLSGSGTYPGFARLFGISPDRVPVMEYERLSSGYDGRDTGKLTTALNHWAAKDRPADPDLAIVIVPRTDRWETDSPYYVAKEFFASRAIPTQMVTEDLLNDTGRLGWSLANIALAGFAKLGGVPWVVDARGHDSDLVVGVGRADINDGAGGRRRTFGYAVAFASDGSFLATHSRPPSADDRDYEQRLTEVIQCALEEGRAADMPTERVVIHLARRTGIREVRAAQAAIEQAGMNHLPTAFLRIDDSSLFEFIDGNNQRNAPPKGLTLRLTERRALIQVEGITPYGPARRPLLIELDERSTVPSDKFGELVLQVFKLGHANWRGFNARSKPVTLYYGERLAEIVGYMNQRGEWDPASMAPELRRRPWFL